MNHKKLQVGVILSFIAGILLVLLAPEDKVLGQVLKLIYLHGALINTSLFLFSALGLLSMASLFRNCPGSSLLFAIEKTAIIFWIAATVIGNITSWLAWGGIFWGEPRLQAMIIISLLSISIYLISSASENPRTISFLGIGLALSVWILIVQAGRIMHPDNPFSVSESPFRLFFIVITLVFLIASIMIVCWIQRKAT